jgi:hypothetical protein
MTLAVFLEVKAERQLIPTADRHLPEPPVIQQQIHPNTEMLKESYRRALTE